MQEKRIRRVTIETRQTGIHFGCYGVVRDARTRRKIAESDIIRPFDMPHLALDDAQAIVERKGWFISPED